MAPAAAKTSTRAIDPDHNEAELAPDGSSGSSHSNESPALDGTGGSSGSGTVGLIDLNTADTHMLEALPGIGPVLAGRIVAYRQQHGTFSSIDELLEINGIGECKLNAVRNLVCIGKIQAAP